MEKQLREEQVMEELNEVSTRITCLYKILETSDEEERIFVQDMINKSEMYYLHLLEELARITYDKFHTR